MILLVANYEPHVGYAWKFIAQFWLALARRRKCHIAYPSPGPVPEEILQAGITPHTMKMRQWGSAAFIRRHKIDRKSTRLNSSHLVISYAVFCLEKNTDVSLLRT